MRIYRFTLYGALLGALFAVLGSFVFGPLAVLLLIPRADIGTIAVGFGYAVIYSVIFSIVPGTVGGAYLARWLEASERTPREVTQRSLFVGGVAGFAAGIGFAGLVLRFNVDSATIGFIVLATTVASVASLLAARWLARKKSRFIQPEIRESGRVEYVEARKESEELK